MNSINTSSNSLDCYICIQDRNSSITCPLLPSFSVSESIMLATKTAVNENWRYDISILAPIGSRIKSIDVSINGSDVVNDAFEVNATTTYNNKTYCVYALNLKNDYLYPFSLTYGFARIKATITFLDASVDDVVLTTLDIPCSTSDPTQATLIRKMLDELLDTEDNTVMNWMLARQDISKNAYSTLDTAYASNAPKSLNSMIQMLEDIVVLYRTNFTYFNNHSFCRVVKEKAKVDPTNIRKIGHNEVQWIAKNTNVLSETYTETNINYMGKYYAPRYVETERKIKTFDNYENKVVLGFLYEVQAQAKNIFQAITRNIETIESLNNALNQVDTSDYELPAAALVCAYTTREEDLRSRVECVIAELSRLIHIYKHALVNVCPIFPRRVQRTKIFQEVREYASVYTTIEKWRRFGDFNLSREQLALHTLRLDKLYEYYTLFRILKEFKALGFDGDYRFEDPIECVSYELEDQYYEPERRVNTIYRLLKGDSAATLYYQPIIYGNLNEEHDITLHRLSASSANQHPYWTPDYLLRLQRDDNITWHIIDAKYSRVEKLWGEYPKTGTFAQTTSKYKGDIGGASKSDLVSSVWLFAGRSSFTRFKFAEQSVWAQAFFKQMHSGVGALTPEQNCFAESLYAMLGYNVEEDTVADDVEIATENIIDVAPEAPETLQFASLALKPAVAEISSEIAPEPLTDNIVLEEAREPLEISAEPSVEKDNTVEDVVEDIVDTVEEETPESKPKTEPEAVSTLISEPEQEPEPETVPISRHKQKKTPAPTKEKTPAKSAHQKREKNDKCEKKQTKKKKVPVHSQIDERFLSEYPEMILDVIVDEDQLYRQTWAQKNLGISHPLFRKVAPTGKEAKLYRKMSVAGEEIYCYSQMKPQEKNRFKMFLVRAEKAKEELTANTKR